MKQFIKCPECGETIIASINKNLIRAKGLSEISIHWNHENCSSGFTMDDGNENLILKAFSIQQPWAWAIVNGLKDIENRSWATKFTGTVLVHAGKKFDNEGYRFLRNAFHQAGRLPELPSKEEFKNWMGGICGSVEITGCVTESKSPWFFGPYGFTLKNAKMMDIVRCNGQLSFFTPKID